MTVSSTKAWIVKVEANHRPGQDGEVYLSSSMNNKHTTSGD